MPMMMYGGVICELCSLKEPLGMAGDTVFWVDYDLCGVWVHTYLLCFSEKCHFTKILMQGMFILIFYYDT